MDFSNVPVESLESLRLRLSQLSHSLTKLQGDLQQTPMINSHWVALQSQFNIILTQLNSLSGTLLQYSDILEHTTVYPIPQFPTTEQEGLLTTLLRKKQMPEVEEWIAESKELIEVVMKKLDMGDDKRLTAWALERLQEEKDKHIYHGLQVEEDAEMTDEVDIRPTLGLDSVLKLMYQGVIPNTVQP